MKKTGRTVKIKNSNLIGHTTFDEKYFAHIVSICCKKGDILFYYRFIKALALIQIERKKKVKIEYSNKLVDNLLLNRSKFNQSFFDRIIHSINL